MTQRQLPARWWEHSSGVMRFFAKTSGITIQDIISTLDDVKDWGFDCVELFAPYHGGTQYSGLDAYDYYTVDPAIGTMDDLLELIERCHEKGLAFITFVNLGYSHMEFPAFLKACDDVRAGVDSPEAHWFLWSDTGTEELDKSGVPFFRNDLHGHWYYSERAGKYYWVKWQGFKQEVEMPQFHFGDPAWQEECKRVVKFWMDTGQDGMVIDAVNWYINCTWEINNETMTDVMRQYPNQYIQPEGSGGFGDDPVPWITEGHYNSVQDYSLAIWWTDHDLIWGAMESGDPTVIEEALQGYRDRVVAAGGVTYLGPARRKHATATTGQKLLEAATLATVGQLFLGTSRMLSADLPEEYKTRLKGILRALQATPALHAAGGRKRVPTNDDHKYYAFLRTSQDGEQRALVVLNFQPEEQDVVVRMEKPVHLQEILSVGHLQERSGSPQEVRLTLLPFGYGIYLVSDS